MRRRTLIGLACGAAAVAAVAAFACIPDLPALPSAPAATGPYCGDGIIQLDAGEHCDPGDTGVAAPPGCTPACQIACPGGLVYLDHCYYRGGDVANLQQASSACDTNNGYVLTVESPDEWAFVLDGAPYGAREPFWINLTATDSTAGYTTVGKVDKPGWRQVICPGCFAEDLDAAAPLPVFPGYPANTFGCVFGDKADPETWFGAPCFLPIGDAGQLHAHVLCERDPPGSYADPSCAPGGLCFTLPSTYPGKRYAYFPESPTTTWVYASQTCASLQGTLVVLQSRDEREELWEALLEISPAPQRIWLGLAFDASANAWVWDDGVAADDSDAYPEPWAENRPIPQQRPGATDRAYDLDQPSFVDTQLASNGQLNQAAFVCEFRK